MSCGPPNGVDGCGLVNATAFAFAIVSARCSQSRLERLNKLNAQQGNYAVLLAEPERLRHTRIKYVNTRRREPISPVPGTQSVLVTIAICVAMINAENEVPIGT